MTDSELVGGPDNYVSLEHSFDFNTLSYTSSYSWSTETVSFESTG
jgi:hypothetical protein